MYRKSFETVLRCSVQQLWEFHSSVEALLLLTPPSRNVTLLSDDVEVREGALHVLRVSVHGLPMVWRARISEVSPPTGFTDTAEQSPFAFWRHRHDFIKHVEGCLLRDTIEYLPPGGPLSGVVNSLLVSRDIDQLFAFRHRVTAEALQ